MAKKKSSITKQKPKTTKKTTTKKTTSTSRKKQTKTKKSTRKRRVNKKQSNSKFIQFIFIFVGIILLVAIGYFWGAYSSKQTIKEPISKRNISNIELDKPKISKPTTNKPKTTIKKKEKPSIKHSDKIQKPSKPKEHIVVKHKQSKTQPKPNIPPKKIPVVSDKLPKVVIIIDDVHTQKQLDDIKSLHMHITPSIFPPYQRAWHTPKLVKGLKHYMIHLPMESKSAKFNNQTQTIMCSWSYHQIQNRIQNIREMFPKARYINNHTGSTFTSDYHSMDMLYKVLKEKGFVFVDSYTTASSVVDKISKKYHDRYVKRDVFIDNVSDISYIKKQIKRGVDIAKKNGYAILIGHPHHTTIDAIKDSKGILKDVKIIYIDELKI